MANKPQDRPPALLARVLGGRRDPGVMVRRPQNARCYRIAGAPPSAAPRPPPGRLGVGTRAGATVSAVEQAFGQRDRDQLRSRPCTGLGHGVAHVCADGVGRDVQRGADLGGDLA
jgi:hypothetical protein